MTLVLTREPTSGAPATAPRRPRCPDAALIAVFAALLSGAAAARPSMWFDEAATISAAANRTLPELWRLLGHIDAVHGLYYLLMHGWFAIFPATEFWSRVPSALAVGVGAAGVVTLTRQFGPRPVAACAGLLYALLPKMTWAGIEARSYAFAAAAAVWLTVLCVRAARRDSAGRWVGYGAAAAAAIVLNIFIALVVPTHAAVIAAGNPARRVWWRWAAAAGAALGLAAPFVVFSQGQIAQVGWIHRLNWHTVIEVCQQQYFDKSVPVTLLAGALLIGAPLAVRTGRRPAPPAALRRLAGICAVWLLAPTAVVLGYSALVKPVYYPRYLICTAPAMAIALAIALTTLVTRPRRIAVAVLVFALAAAPNYLVTQRDRHAKEGWDYSEVADVIAAHAATGDCLLIDNSTTWAPGPIRALTAGRPGAFAALTDPGRGPHGPDLGRLWDGHIGVWAIAEDLDRCTTIFTITDHDPALPAEQAGPMLPDGARFARSPAGQVLHRLGFHAVARWQFTFAQVVRSTR